MFVKSSSTNTIKRDMSVITFTLTEDHLKLVKNLIFTADAHTLISGKDGSSPFGGGEFYEDLGLVIYGNTQGEFDPLSDEGPTYTTEQKIYLESLFQDLPQALEVVLGASTFKPGTYKRKWHGLPQDWKLK